MILEFDGDSIDRQKVERRVISIPETLEQKPDFIRNLYLDWFHDLSKNTVCGTTLDKLFSFEEFDIWAMSDFVENSILESSPHIDNAIRILALMDLLRNHYSPCEYCLSIKSEDKLLIQCFSQQIRPNSNSKIVFARIYSLCLIFYDLLNVLFNQAKGIFWLLKTLLESIQFDRIQVKRWIETDADNIFVSYFCNFEVKNGDQVSTRSKYWTSLQDKIFKTKDNTKWLYLYFKNPQIKSVKEANCIINGLNNSANQIHACVNSCFDLGLACKTLKVFLKATKLTARFNPKTKFRLSSVVNMWPLFKDSWNKSFYGSSLMSAIAARIMFSKCSRAFNQKVSVFARKSILASLHASILE